MSSVENRYAEARPNAAAMIAADWSGGAIKTSFFRGLTGEVPGRSAKCRLADVRPFPRGVKPRHQPVSFNPIRDRATGRGFVPWMTRVFRTEKEGL